VVRSALRRLLPLTFGLGVYQINVLLSRLFTSYLPAGPQSHFYYAQRLVEIPQGMFAVAISSASLPVLSDL
jgi:putative peptidoglycan lipid II flippase